VTGERRQLAARRLRVFERGVFHFGFAMIAFRYRRAAARCIVTVRTAGRAESGTIRTTEGDEREIGADKLTNKILEIEGAVMDDVCFTERIADRVEIEMLIDAQCTTSRELFKTAITNPRYRENKLTVQGEVVIDPVDMQRQMRLAGKSEASHRRQRATLV